MTFSLGVHSGTFKWVLHKMKIISHRNSINILDEVYSFKRKLRICSKLSLRVQILRCFLNNLTRSNSFNSFKTGVPFMGLGQTV